MGKPAARIGDMHICPKIDPGPRPHIGGPLQPPGEPTVLIGGRPAARASDSGACMGSEDTVEGGAESVKIGGEAAARKGDQTAHGGVITEGFESVLIGRS